MSGLKALTTGNSLQKLLYKRKRLWLAILLLIFALAATPFLLNPIKSFNSCVNYGLRLLGIEAKMVRADRYRVAYYEGGKEHPRTVLLLHGMGGNALFTWMQLMPALAKHYHVIAPNLLASNFLQLNPDTYSIDSEVNLVVALLDRLGIEKTDIVGLSVGGWVGLIMALEHPQQVGKLILVESAGLTTEVPELARLTLDDREKAKRFLKLLFYYPPPLPGFVLDNLIKISTRIKPQYLAVFEGFINNSRARVLDDKLSQIPHRTLILHGREDQVIPLEVGQRLAKGLPNAELVILERSGHAPVWDSPRQLKKNILRFLSEP
jgi:pimeloyl-ACP methyl ester carboxylesterase